MTDSPEGAPAPSDTGSDAPSGSANGTPEEPVSEGVAASPAPEAPAPQPAPEAPAPQPAPEAPAAQPQAAEAAGAEPKKTGITLGTPRKPVGPRGMIIRIGIALVALLILATIGVGGYAVFRGKPSATTPGSTPTPTGSPGESYYTWGDAKFQISVDRPNDWTTRITDANSNPSVALVIGPPDPYPSADLVSVQVVQLNQTLGAQALVQFKNYLLDHWVGHDNTIFTQDLAPVTGGMPGWYFLWTAPAANPTVLHAGYYFLDGNRMIAIVLQIEPANDQNSLTNLLPVFQHVAQSLVSYYVIPSAGTASPAPAATTTH